MTAVDDRFHHRKVIMTTNGDYSWDSHPEAVLGTIYLHFTFDGKVPPSEILAFVARHQDGGRLSEAKASAALAAVSKLDGGHGLHHSGLLGSMWTALVSALDGGPPNPRPSNLVSVDFELNGHLVDVAWSGQFGTFKVTKGNSAVTAGVLKNAGGRWGITEMDPNYNLSIRQDDLETAIRDALEKKVRG